MSETKPGILRDNAHVESCRCQECFCEKHRFSLRRPTVPHPRVTRWRYPECPFCTKGDPAVYEPAPC